MRERRAALDELAGLLTWAASYIAKTDEAVGEHFSNEVDRLLREVRGESRHKK
jgi:hypothetical protein